MSSRGIGFFLCLWLAGCGNQAVTLVTVDPADPQLMMKLGVTDQDWSRIKELAATEKEFVIKDVAKAAPDIIDAELKKPSDVRGDQGGPVVRFQKKDGRWAKQADFHGAWAVGK